MLLKWSTCNFTLSTFCQTKFPTRHYSYNHYHRVTAHTGVIFNVPPMGTRKRSLLNPTKLIRINSVQLISLPSSASLCMQSMVLSLAYRIKLFFLFTSDVNKTSVFKLLFPRFSVVYILCVVNWRTMTELFTAVTTAKRLQSYRDSTSTKHLLCQEVNKVSRCTKTLEEIYESCCAEGPLTPCVRSVEG